MNKRFNLLYIVFRDVIMVVTFLLAINLEKAGSSRLLYMIAFFVLLFIWMHVRDFFRDRYIRIIPYSFVVDLTILILLDYSSKYVVNYYFNVYYFYVLIAAGFIIKYRQRLIVSFAIIAAALIKYFRLMEMYNYSFVFSYLFFMLMVFITLAVFFNYSKILSEEKSKLDSLNRELKRVNEVLELKNEKIRDLTIYEERNRIAREIHDNVGHNLTGLVMNLDFCEKIAQGENPKLKKQLGKSKDIAKESLAEIRKSVQALKPKDFEQLPIIKSLEELVKSSEQKFNIKAVLNVTGEVYNTILDFNIALYRVVQEAITNSVRHGSADSVEVSMAFSNSVLSLLIKDNGKGKKGLKMGNGLKGMVERMKEFEGDVSFFGSNGFMVNIKVPKDKIV